MTSCCDKPTVTTLGRKSSNILVVGYAPSLARPKSGWGKSTLSLFGNSTYPFRKEIERAGLEWHDLRIITVWQHEETKERKKKGEITQSEICLQHGYENVIKEAEGKDAILLVGAKTFNLFSEYNVSDTCGLFVNSTVLSCDIIMPLLSPGIMFSKGVGETRLALSKFVIRLEKEGII